jgi:hypothetical protein
MIVFEMTDGSAVTISNRLSRHWRITGEMANLEELGVPWRLKLQPKWPAAKDRLPLRQSPAHWSVFD